MASFAAVCRISARLASGRAARGFTTSSRCLAAQNFVMPALSPTMTEGNIANWKVKEGDSFSAGDVLLEIETDKATMDVEAQEDGIMMKIFSQDGSKGVQVGTRIAVLAEAGDDISALELPPDEQSQQAAQSTSEPAAPTPREEPKAASKPTAKSEAAASGTYDHNYPLLPSVGLLVHEHGISKEDLSKIKGTGPNGRLLKGDVLAYVGAINADRPAAVSSHLNKLAHLDLSNIKVAEKKAAPAPKAPATASKGPDAAPKPEKVLVQLPISLEKIAELQRRLESTADVSVPITQFVSTATAFANDRLPAVPRAPTPSELFDEVLGLNKAKATKFSHGSYVPTITDDSAGPRRTSAPKTDIIDFLAGPARKSSSSPAQRRAPTIDTRLAPGGVHFFGLLVPKEEKDRAKMFLERFKLALEEFPEKLI